MTDDIPTPDQAPGAPHPREAVRLFGQDRAERAFLQAHSAGRLHHGWLLTGPRGVGKATLAWRIARFLLATPPAEDDGLFGAPPPPETLDISPDHPVAHRMLAGSEPGLACITRTPNEKTGRLRDQIAVEDIRKLGRFFGLSATDGGHRVVIVDAADDMNVSAANALLKMLEEPPARTTLLLISHQPSRLLPTIRSRCRTLRLSELSPQNLAAALAQAVPQMEMLRNYSTRRICQVDIADIYDHKHQSLSQDNDQAGLSKMSIDITKAFFRKLATDGVVFNNGLFRTLKATYLRIGLDLVDSYRCDALMNGLDFDVHTEEQMVELFAENLMKAGDAFINNPLEQPFIPHWNRVVSAIPDIYEQLIDAVEKDHQLYGG